jgi:hypothetical protein
MIADIEQFPAKAQAVNGNSVDAEWLGVVECLTGFTGLSCKQEFTCNRRRELHQPKLRIDAREYIVTDSFTNQFVVFAADLIDGERHLVPTRIGSEVRGLRAKWSVYGKFDDDMLAHLQDEAMVIFGRQTVAIMQARQAANVPTRIITADSPSELPALAVPATLEPQIALTDAPLPSPVANPQIVV